MTITGTSNNLIGPRYRTTVPCRTYGTKKNLQVLVYRYGTGSRFCLLKKWPDTVSVTYGHTVYKLASKIS
jgi:hypothetical protein